MKSRALLDIHRARDWMKPILLLMAIALIAGSREACAQGLPPREFPQELSKNDRGVRPAAMLPGETAETVGAADRGEHERSPDGFARDPWCQAGAGRRSSGRCGNAFPLDSDRRARRSRSAIRPGVRLKSRFPPARKGSDSCSWLRGLTWCEWSECSSRSRAARRGTRGERDRRARSRPTPATTRSG